MKRFAQVSTVVLMFVLGILFLAQATESQFAARELNKKQLGSLYGGCWQDYCIVTLYTCNSEAGNRCNLLIHDGLSCFRCVNDIQKEGCDGDNWCIPFITCTDCVVDTPHDCGKETSGTCWYGQGCKDQTLMDSDCGEADQCHTS